jgi:N-acetylglucosaminyldiphosphoundecaprenol N-acetyl-beta-D-mannosaminyltransferase
VEAIVDMRPESSLQPSHAPAEEPRTVDVLATPLALTDYGRTIDWMDSVIEQRWHGYVCVCNVHTVMASIEDRELRSALLGSSLNVPDGQPLVWAINALGHSLAGRVYGPELMSRACAHAAETGHRYYLYGGRNQGALVQLALNLRQRFPGVRIVGGYAPPHRPLSEEEREAVVEDRRPEAGEMDGPNARASRRPAAGRRRRGLRLPRRAGPPGAQLAPGVRAGVGVPVGP